jgi:hypothetical protein
MTGFATAGSFEVNHFERWKFRLCRPASAEIAFVLLVRNQNRNLPTSYSAAGTATFANK